MEPRAKDLKEHLLDKVEERSHSDSEATTFLKIATKIRFNKLKNEKDAK